ncbi:MAG: efflux RND transporter permease subunit, partial [Chloroflexota bacterium]|nr:efflux RND transporter permease subunit [Chloroflexota bacterium]
MGLTRVSLLRPVAITMLFLALAAMGIVAYTRLPVERFPNISFPFVAISVSYPGAAPEDVERLVTKPLEDAVVGINGISELDSTSSEGNSRVSIRFVEGTDVGSASIYIERKVNGVRRRLPTGASDPSIITADPNSFPVMNVAISSDKLDLQTLTSVVNDQIAPLIQSVPGVADAGVRGGATRQIQIRVDMNKLRSYGFSLAQVQNALATQNVSLPGGVIRTQQQVFNTRTEALAQAPSDLGLIVLNATPGASAGSTANTVVGSASNAPVFLKDVATVQDTVAFQTSFQRLNGKTAVGLSVTQQAGTNQIAVAEGVRTAIQKLQQSMGSQSGIRFDVVNDQSIFTRAAVNDVQRNLYIAILLTAFVLLMFLHTLRNTLMVLVAIPTSIVSTFFVMFLLGFNLDTMSLMALALLIGILVDD